MRIIEYYAENFKRLRLVNFKPKGRMTIFTGKNDQGKSSAIDVVPFVLGGKKHSPEMPKRKGAQSMKCRLNLGEFTVERTESGFKLLMAPGTKAWDTPQKMLDSIFDELAFDPMEFVQMKPLDQVEMLRKSLKLDEKLKQLDVDNAADFDKRRIVNREADRLTAEIATFIVQPGLPKAKVDDAAIEAKITSAGDHNKEVIAQIEAKSKLAAKLADLEQAEARHKQFLIDTEGKISSHRNAAQEFEMAIPIAGQVLDEFTVSAEKLKGLPDGAKISDEISGAFNVLRRYKGFLQSAYDNAAMEWKRAEDALTAGQNRTAELAKSVVECRRAFEEAPTGELVDTNQLMEELKSAQLVNREIDKRTRLADLEKEREARLSESRALTRAMETRQEKKDAAIAGAKLPVEGLSFTEGEVIFNGVPLQQLGEAQQIKISVALVLARQPKLRLCLIKHGEALDEDSMDELEAMAEEMDFYIWMAKVDSSGKMGIFLEDGEIKINNEDDGDGPGDGHAGEL